MSAKKIAEVPETETFGKYEQVFPEYLTNRDADSTKEGDGASLVSKQDLIERHGGQDFFNLLKSEKYVADFSLTCNSMGPPRKALQAAHNALGKISHYPPEDQEPCRSHLAKFIAGAGDVGAIHDRLVLGNGASELIDLIIRNAPNGAFWPGPFDVQYKEYERSSKSMGRRVLKHTDNKSACSVMAIVNPCNPTGDFLDLPQLQGMVIVRRYASPEKDSLRNGSETILSRSQDGCTVMVDESMLGWYGPDWRDHSLSGSAGLKWIAEQKWDCPGLRVGSVVCPTPVERLKVIAHQIPWSMNISALDFLTEATLDEEYLWDTWDRVSGWRAQFVEKLNKLQPHWKVKGEKWISWMWIDTLSYSARAQAVELCKNAGVPIRDGAIGYFQPTHIRICVRGPRDQEVILKELAKVGQVE